MYTDKNTRIAEAASLTAGTTTYTDGIDLGALTREIGEGQDLYMVFTVTTTVAGSGNVYFEAGYSSSSSSPSSSFVPFGQATGYSAATLTAGTQIVIRLNPLVNSPLATPDVTRGLRYVYGRAIAATQPSAGAVTCDIVTDIQDGKKFYSSGISFS